VKRHIPPGYVLGADGKVYPYRPLTDEQRTAMVGRVHYMRHADHLSVRGIIARLAGEGFRASVGTVHTWLGWQCDRCSGEVSRAPEQPAGVVS
jgi:hypothetical protein